MMISLMLAILIQAAAPASPRSNPSADMYGDCVLETATQFAKSSEKADTVVEAVLAKCRPRLERYLADAPVNSLAAQPNAKAEIRRALITMAREDALVRVLELRSK